MPVPLQLGKPPNSRKTRNHCFGPAVRPEIPIDIDFLDAAGKTLPTGGVSTMEMISSAAVRAPLDAVRQIRIRRYSKIDRFVLRLPQIPGLPPENQTISNLFDVRVPYLAVQSGNELLSQALVLAQLDPAVNGGGAIFPPGYFPRAYTNVTPRELLFEYRRFTSPPARFAVDPQTYELLARPLPWPWFWLEARKFFKGI